MIIYRLREYTWLDDRFELLERLGCGAFSDVWRARRLSDGQLVALKIPRDQELGDETLHKEPSLLRQLIDENVVQMFGWHMLAGLFVIELELIEGRTRMASRIWESPHSHTAAVSNGGGAAR